VVETVVVTAAAAAAAVAAAAVASFTLAASASTPAKKLLNRFLSSAFCSIIFYPPHFLSLILCQRYGRVSGAFVPSDSENPGRNRGFGFVTFEEAGSAQVIT
jgi:hypothetical protein